MPHPNSKTKEMGDHPTYQYYADNLLRIFRICEIIPLMKEVGETEGVIKLLKKAGFRATRGRQQLLEFLRSSHAPLSAPTIATHMAGTLDQANVYRSLEALVDKGLLRRIDIGHGHADYEFVGSGMHHHHLICRSCKAIEDVMEFDMRQIETRVLTHSKMFRKIDDHTLEFFGLCNSCASA